MSLLPVAYDYLGRWWNKGLSFWNLRAADGAARGSLQQALESLVVGLLIALLIQSLVLVYYIPTKNLFIQFLGLPLYGIVIIANIAVFVLLLYAALRALGIKLELRLVAALACYRLSGAVPLIILFAGEQRSEAIRLFTIHRDIGLPYMYTAIRNLLLSDHALMFAIARSWCFALLQIAVYICYILWGLPKVLFEASCAPWKSVRIVIGIILTCIADAIWVYSYFGRLYWWIMAGLLKD
jgi:hypothetical protein